MKTPPKVILLSIGLASLASFSLTSCDDSYAYGPPPHAARYGHDYDHHKRDLDRNWSRDRNHHRNWDNDRDRDRDWGRDRDRDWDRDRDRDWDRDRDRRFGARADAEVYGGLAIR